MQKWLVPLYGTCAISKEELTNEPDDGDYDGKFRSQVGCFNLIETSGLISGGYNETIKLSSDKIERVLVTPRDRGLLR